MRKYSNAFSSYSAKTKRDRGTDIYEGRFNIFFGHTPPSPRWKNVRSKNVGNSIKREEIIQIFALGQKNIIKNSNNIPSISKTIQHTPMTWCTYLQLSFEKIHQCVFALRKYINAFLLWENTSNAFLFCVTVRKLNVTDRQMGALQYIPSRAFGAAGDNKSSCKQ